MSSVQILPIWSATDLCAQYKKIAGTQELLTVDDCEMLYEYATSGEIS